LFPYAIDKDDRKADLFLSCNERGEPHDHFHSLHYLSNDPRVKHEKKIRVTCKTLKSLLNEGIIEKNCGILKIDTEGNDLHVLKGMGELRPEVVICEFFTKGLFAGWEQGNPQGLINEAKKLGYKHYVSVKRYNGRELVSFSPAVFYDQQWGNLFFLNDTVYRRSFKDLRECVISSEKKLFTANIKQEDQMQSKQNGTDVCFQYLSSLENWLRVKIKDNPQTMKGNILIDAGAYQGGFAKRMINAGYFKKAFLFEPNPKNVAFLEKTFSKDIRFNIQKMALSDHIGDATFYCDENLATGSILPYSQLKSSYTRKIESFPVKQTTLDHQLGILNHHDCVGLIKIDTQGYGLNVLKGAEITIQKSQPWLVVELIFVPLYKNQSTPLSIYNWMVRYGYTLSAIFNEHYTKDKWLAFADAVFVPRQIVAGCQTSYHMKPDYIFLQNEIQKLRQVCTERLELINFLNEEAEKRLEIIHRLETGLKNK